MACRNCEEPSEWYADVDLEFSKVLVDKQVPAGQTWHVYASVYNNSIIFGDKGRVCVYDGDTVIAKSEQFSSKPRETTRITLSGKMPKRDVYLNVSLVDEDFWESRCCDGHAAFIKEGPYITVDPGDPAEKEDEKDLAEWLEDNLVLVLTLVLVIIALLKFG